MRSSRPGSHQLPGPTDPWLRTSTMRATARRERQVIKIALLALRNTVHRERVDHENVERDHDDRPCRVRSNEDQVGDSTDARQNATGDAGPEAAVDRRQAGARDQEPDDE